MPGQGVGLVALVLLGPLIQSAGSWTLLERFFFQPQALPSCNDSGNASSCNNNTPDNATQGSHSKGTSEDRGSTSSPDPTEDAEWLWWFLVVGWISMWRLADTSLIWCGTLCASVGVAAKWSYWLMVSIVGIFLMQLCLWSVTWVICPFLRHLQALYRYLRGYGGWHEVAHLHGFRVFRPRWTGPKGAEEWSSDFVQQSVRGRGDSRDPFDLLVTDGVAIARLRHGTLRGRTNRHGYRCNGGTVYASSHRYFRNQLEALGLEIHLCATVSTSRPARPYPEIRSWICMKLQAVVRLGGVWWQHGSGGVAARPSLRLPRWQRWFSHAFARVHAVPGAVSGWPRMEKDPRHHAMLTRRRNPKVMTIACVKRTTLGTWSMGQGRPCRFTLAETWRHKGLSGYSQVTLRRVTRRN